VSEQVGDHVDAAAEIGDVGGEGVPQLVRTDRPAQPGPPRGRREQFPDRVRTQRRADWGADRFTNTKSLAAACDTRIRSNS
jgi:hypothetical protein